jgi:hypothetical protein
MRMGSRIEQADDMLCARVGLWTAFIAGGEAADLMMRDQQLINILEW